MSAEKSFYKSLGQELMRELSGSYIGAKLISGGALGAYKTLTLPNGMSVRFTSWRRGRGPFYIILFNGAKDVFELDLSMIVHGSGRFKWHLKIPSHEENKNFLGNWLGQPKPMASDYSAQVKQVKKSLGSGVNTPQTGYPFIDDADWFGVCDRFYELISRAIKAHTDVPLVEAEDDDGSVVDMKRKFRRNRSLFRLNMMEVYGSACAISGEGVVEVLEAAHIVGHAETGINSTRNGLLLRADLHRLFDAGLVAIHPASLEVVICSDLAKSNYQKFSGQKLRSRIDGSSPDKKYLEIRWSQAVLQH